MNCNSVKLLHFYFLFSIVLKKKLFKYSVHGTLTHQHRLLSATRQFDGTCTLFLCRIKNIHLKICCQLDGNLASDFERGVSKVHRGFKGCVRVNLMKHLWNILEWSLRQRLPPSTKHQIIEFVMESHPPQKCSRHLYNLFQGALKLFWQLVTAQCPIKTLCWCSLYFGSYLYVQKLQTSKIWSNYRQLYKWFLLIFY